MNPEIALQELRANFPARYRVPREEGLEEMAQHLAEAPAVSYEDAREALRELEARGDITFVAVEEPDAPAMLEAARYGDMPAQGTAEGYWLLER